MPESFRPSALKAFGRSAFPNFYVERQRAGRKRGQSRKLYKVVRSGPTGTIEFAVPMNTNDIVLVKVICREGRN
jgi:hypothetical protein